MCTDFEGGEQTAIAEDKFLIQPHKSFSLNFATSALASLRFPEKTSFQQWLNPAQARHVESDETMTEYAEHGEDDAGMGRVRMALVRLGCRVNLDAPSTVSCHGPWRKD